MNAIATEEFLEFNHSVNVLLVSLDVCLNWPRRLIWM